VKARVTHEQTQIFLLEIRVSCCYVAASSASQSNVRFSKPHSHCAQFGLWSSAPVNDAGDTEGPDACGGGGQRALLLLAKVV
jgi:hypothetical protein